MIRFFLIANLLCLTNICHAQDFAPSRSVEEMDDGVIVTYTFKGGMHSQDRLYPNAKSWIIPGFGVNDVAGEPSIPCHWDTFAVPQGTSVSIALLDSISSDTTFVMTPAYPPLMNSGTEIYTTNNVIPITLYDGFYPQRIVKLENIQFYRGQGLVNIGIFPVHYNMRKQIVRHFSKIRYKLTFTKTHEIKDSLILQSKHLSRISSSDSFIKNIALNYYDKNTVELKKAGIQDTVMAQMDNRNYLIITTDRFLESIKTFADWKQTKGFRVTTESRSAWSDTLAVREVVEHHYAQDSIQYILIVGDFEDVPAPIRDFVYVNDSITYHYTHATDLYYRMMDSDNIPDIYAGRISISNEEELETIFDKIINYEKEPILSSNFYDTALHCAFFEDENVNKQEDRRFVQTSEKIKEHVENQSKYVKRVYYAFPHISPMRFYNGTLLPNELQIDNYAWAGNANDIVDSINHGVFYILHRDHGAINSWYKPSFNKFDIQRLQNGRKQPVVFSLNCLTGKYNNSDIDCFSEAFLKKQNGGCVAIIGATRQSFTPMNDYMAEHIFKAIWPISEQNQPCYEIASILHNGIQKSINNCSPTSPNYRFYIYTQEIFHCFGDPSMMMYTETPSTFLQPSITRNDSIITVCLNDGKARISFYNSCTNHVDSYIGSYIEYPNSPDGIIVCLDRHNYVPFIQYATDAYIQNETVTFDRNYNVTTLKIGKQVTRAKPMGEVIINADVIVKDGTTIELHSGTSVNKGTITIQ